MTSLLVALALAAPLFAPRVHGVVVAEERLVGKEDDVRLGVKFLWGESIVPGTKWCGKGNISAHRDDLGTEWQVDSCCREHDECDDVIEAGHTKHGLTNHRRTSKLNCACDEKFLRCLKDVTSGACLATTVRRGYFLYYGQCFKEEHPIVECKEKNKYVFYVLGAPKVKRVCRDYQLDTSAPKRYQWFDLDLPDSDGDKKLLCKEHIKNCHLNRNYRLFCGI